MMILKIAEFVAGKRKSFFISLAVFAGVFVLFVVRPGLFITDFIGWIALAGAVVTGAAVVVSYVVKK